MYIYYSIGNNSGLWTLVRIVEVSVIGGVCFRRFHCNHILPTELETKCTRPLMYFRINLNYSFAKTVKELHIPLCSKVSGYDSATHGPVSILQHLPM